MDTILLAYTKTQVSKQTCLTKRGKLSYKLTITLCELYYLQQVNKSLNIQRTAFFFSSNIFFLLNQTLKHSQRLFTYAFQNDEPHLTGDSTPGVEQ